MVKKTTYTEDLLGSVEITTGSHNALSKRGKSYSWLDNDYSSLSWQFATDDTSKAPSAYKMVWARDELKTPHWLYWVNVAKELCATKMEVDEIKTSSGVGYAYNLRSFFRFLCFERYCLLIGDVTLDDVEAYKELLAESNLKVGTLESKLNVVNDAYKFIDKAGIGLEFNPFPLHTVRQWAAKNGISNGHTKTLLPREIFFLLNEALKRVKMASRTLENTDAYMEYRRKSDEGIRGYSAPSLAEKFKRDTGVKVSQLYNELQALYGAALTICFILVAERKHEANARLEEDLFDLLNEELDILYGLERKTSGSLSGKRTEVAVIDEVKEAFKVIMEITKHQREDSGEAHVLLKLPWKHSASRGDKFSFLDTGSMYRVLEAFANSCGLNIKLRPHQFRRAYSMIWTWRYEIGDLEELCIMLKHNSLAFTKTYSDDENIWEFLPESEHMMVLDVLNDAVNKKIKITGGASDTVKRLGRLIQANSRLTDPESISIFLDSALSSGNFIVIPHYDGYCILTKEAISKSECFDGEELSDALRTPERCVKCPNFGMDEHRKHIWVKRRESHQAVVESSCNDFLKERSLKFIEDVDRVFSKGEGNGD